MEESKIECPNCGGILSGTAPEDWADCRKCGSRYFLTEKGLVEALPRYVALKNIRLVRRCRSCGARKLREVLSLGDQYVSNFIPEGKKPQIKAPLNLMECQECGLVQLEHTVDRDLIYRKYWYHSATDPIMCKALKDVVEDTLKRVKVREGMWIDIGSNDATLLKQIPDGWTRMGFEPAENFKKDYPIGTILIQNYFNAKDYQTLTPISKKKADVITCAAMFYDLENPNKFVEDVKEILAPDGIFVIQQNYLPTMIERNIYDNIGHEHLEYYSLATLSTLLKSHGLEVFDVELNDVNGGSFRTYIGHKDAYQITESVARLAAYESQVMGGTVYQLFVGRIEEGRRKLTTFAIQERDADKKIYGCGAGNRGNTILQYLDAHSPINLWLTAIADQNPEKWGKHTPGTNIPIISKEQIRQDKPAYLLILAYFYLNSFIEEFAEYLKNGGQFIVPVPVPRIIRLENGEVKTVPI